ncbi:MAG: DUF4249 family protein [Ignavibacteriales bacterium]|nr:DUF4249 family protein [Ignavibacteriales bacterium]
MIKIFTYTFSIVIIFLFTFCEEGFNPKTQFEEQYIAYCILSGDTNYQTATLFKSYYISGVEPYENTNDPSIQGAEINIIHENTTYTFKDSTATRTDTSRYKTPIRFYYLNNFKPNENKSLQLKITLPNGKILSSETRTPRLTNFTFQYSDQNIPENDGRVGIQWDYYYKNSENLVFYPRLKIYYEKFENGIQVDKSQVIPTEYLLVDDEYVPYYPSIVKFPMIVYTQSAIDKTFKDISKNDPNKQNYTIKKVVFELLLLNNELAPYYMSITGSSEGLSVILDGFDYSNIEGGLGVFGVYYIKKLIFSVSSSYINSFGYKY